MLFLFIFFLVQKLTSANSVSADNFYFFFFLTKLTSTCIVCAGKFFSIFFTKLTSTNIGKFCTYTQNLPALALFALVSFFFFSQNLLAEIVQAPVSYIYIHTKFTNTCTVYAAKFPNKKKNWTKVAMIMWDPLFKHFCRFSHFLVCVAYASTVCTSLYQFSTKNSEIKKDGEGGGSWDYEILFVCQFLILLIRIWPSLSHSLSRCNDSVLPKDD